MHTSHVVSEKFSCIKEITKVVHIALPSLYISNEITGVSEILDSWKSQYIKQLQGVVVNYKNASLTSRSGYCTVDKSFIRYDVKATFELFCPSVGSIIEGKINRISREHIGCLVHKVINVSIHLSKNTTDEMWKLLLLDRTIFFKVARVDFNRGFIRLKGEITEECVELTKKFYPIQNNIFDTETCVNDSNSSSEESIQTIINVKNKNAQEVESVDIQSSFDYSLISDDNITKQPIENDKKAKKKKKRDAEFVDDKRYKKEKHRRNEINNSLEKDDNLLLKNEITYASEGSENLNVEAVEELMSNLPAFNSSESFLGNIKKEKKSKKKKEKDMDDADHKKDKKIKHRANDFDISLEDSINLIPKKEIPDLPESCDLNVKVVDELSNLNAYSNESFLDNIKKHKKSKKKKKDEDDKRDKKQRYETTESNISLENNSIDLLPKKEVPDVSESNKNMNIEKNEFMSNLNICNSSALFIDNIKKEPLENEKESKKKKKNSYDTSHKAKRDVYEVDSSVNDSNNALLTRIGASKIIDIDIKQDTEEIDKLSSLNAFNPEFQTSSAKEQLIEKSKKSKKRKKDMSDIEIEKNKKSKKRKKDMSDIEIEKNKKSKKRKKDSLDTGKEKKKKKKHDKDRKKSHKKDKKSD